MQAITYRRYGPPDTLAHEDIEKPVPGDDEVLVRIRAAAVNPYDWHFMRGEPLFLRLFAGLRRPRNPRLGVDGAGYVEAVGKRVTEFKPGDEVFGACRGALAEYAIARPSNLAAKPASISFEQAASVPIAGLTALSGVRDSGHAQPGQRVLINGAAGGVGTFAVQLARHFGAEVDGVCSTRNVELVRSLGASRVFDYTREDFTWTAERYDLVLDTVGNRSFAAIRHVLKPKGIHALVGGPTGRWMFGALAHVVAALVLSLFRSRGVRPVRVKPGYSENLAFLASLIGEGKLTPVIDRRYPLRELPQAIAYLEEGHVRGKVVITVE